MSGPKTLSGTIKTTGTGSLFNIIFSFGTYIFTLVSKEICQPFVITSATITYNSDDQLTGYRTVTGIIGNSAKFTFENGPTVDGTLVSPIVPQCTLQGNGTWNKGE